jgi:hypothetical protein
MDQKDALPTSACAGVSAGGDDEGGSSGGDHGLAWPSRGAEALSLAAEGLPLSDLLPEAQRSWGLPPGVSRLLERCLDGEAVAAFEAIPVGADLVLVPARWALELLAGEQGVLEHTDAESAQRTAVERVVMLYQRKFAGEDPPEDEWVAASHAAEAAGKAATADHSVGPAAHAAAAAYAAAAAQAPEATPLTVQVAGMRAAAMAAVDDTGFKNYHTALVEADAVIQAADYAHEAMMDAAEAAFEVVFTPIKDAAERARAALDAGRAVAGEDAAAWEQARAAGEAASATLERYAEWRIDRLLYLLTQAPTST